MDENIIEIVNNFITLDIADESVSLSADNTVLIDYPYAENKPQINSVELIGNQSASVLGLVSSAEMESKEDIENKVIVLEEAASDIQYPSAKCVRDELLTKANVSLSNLSAAGEAILNTKANTDLSNLSVIGQGILGAKASVDLSNLSVTGQGVIDGKADVDGSNMANSVKNFDGGWVFSNFTLVSGGSIPSSTTKSFDLSSYLPDDGYNYEIVVNATGTTGTSSGNGQTVAVRTNITGENYYIYRTMTRSSSYVSAAGTVILPIGTDRILYQEWYGTAINNSGTYDMVVKGYRRIGTNS